METRQLTMKTLLHTVLACLFSMGLQAQLIENRGFEEWLDINEIGPRSYETGNIESNAAGAGNIVVQDLNAKSGSYALHLETVIQGADTLFGYIINGDFDNQTGGFAINQRPDSLAGYFKCDVMPGDTALAIVFFRNAGVPIGFCSAPFTGTQSTFVRFAQEITWLVPSIAPDSAIFAAASSNAINEIGIADGSTLTLDSIHFIGTGITQNIPNNDFEIWDTLTFHRPVAWSTFADDAYAIRFGLVERISNPSDVYSGDYSIKINSLIADNDSLFGLLSKQKLFDSNSGGIEYTRNVDTLNGYYKYVPQGNDSSFLWLEVKNNGVWEFFGRNLPAAANWTYFELPFATSTMGTVDSLRMTFSSSTLGGFGSGSSLWLDELDFKVCDLPDDPGAITGLDSMCEGEPGVLYSIDPIANAQSYVWTMPFGFFITSNPDSNAILVDVTVGSTGGDVVVSGAVYCGVGNDTSLTTVVNVTPAKPVISVNASQDSLVSSLSGSDYIWFHNGVQLAAQTQTVLGAQTGEYRVVVINNSCVSDTSDAFSFVALNVGESLSSRVQVFPIPAYDYLFIDTELQILQVKLMDMNGRLVQEVQGSIEKLNLQGLERGIYSLELIGADWNYVRKVAKQ